jgi:hypothetical protein
MPLDGHANYMTLKPKLLVAGAVAATLALPAQAADAKHPIRGTFLNNSAKNGVRLTTTRYTITSISFYCARSRWDLIRGVDVHRDGSFSFRGRLRQYGPMGQPWGMHRARFSGRFTTRRRVRIERRLPGRCGTGTVRAKGKRR